MIGVTPLTKATNLSAISQWPGLTANTGILDTFNKPPPSRRPVGQIYYFLKLFVGGVGGL